MEYNPNIEIYHVTIYKKYTVVAKDEKEAELEAFREFDEDCPAPSEMSVSAVKGGINTKEVKKSSKPVWLKDSH